MIQHLTTFSLAPYAIRRPVPVPSVQTIVAAGADDAPMAAADGGVLRGGVGVDHAAPSRRAATLSCGKAGGVSACVVPSVVKGSLTTGAPAAGGAL
ncbi:hypothetical protein [Sandarakinorhabdus sp.]|uniref:hypothetical protein n=1 Tax=Sandarakinorhabdus sp. TaxID=1916663 RepID=UPI00286E3485|nr:hypothetical protein [Sandarakinorhabdus sp.]